MKNTDIFFEKIKDIIRILTVTVFCLYVCLFPKFEFQDWLSSIPISVAMYFIIATALFFYPLVWSRENWWGPALMLSLVPLVEFGWYTYVLWGLPVHELSIPPTFFFIKGTAGYVSYIATCLILPMAIKELSRALFMKRGVLST